MIGVCGHIYLSPHLDDAILSCGGLIDQQRRAGESVIVITLCAGSPDYSQLSPFAQQYHATWGNLYDLVASRRAEDQAVLDAWGVKAHHCQTLDSLYRRIKGQVVYPNLKALFAEPHPQEADALPKEWQRELERLFSNHNETVVYAPLAAGNHVDHQLGRLLAQRLMSAGWQVWFYEDYPHIEKIGSLQEAQCQFEAPLWQARTVPIDVEAKLAAIRGYRTQIPSLFGDEHAMIRRVKRFTAETACDISAKERIRRKLVGRDGRREHLWRAIWGYAAHAERFWRLS